jgi:hypothetical protein
MTDTDRKTLEIAMHAMKEARRRALERGLDPVEIDREEDDADSIYWEDFRSIVREMKARASTH